MSKLLLPTAIFLVCAGMGVGYVLELVYRKKELVQTLEWIRYLRREVRCSALPLHRVFSDCPIDSPLLRALDCSEPFDLALSYSVASDAVRAESFLTNDDWTPLDRLFRTLGQGDLSEQEASLALCEEELVERLRDARGQMGKNAKPALVLGCSAGAVLWLLML